MVLTEMSTWIIFSLKIYFNLEIFSQQREKDHPFHHFLRAAPGKGHPSDRRWQRCLLMGGWQRPPRRLMTSQDSSLPCTRR